MMSRLGFLKRSRQPSQYNISENAEVSIHSYTVGFACALPLEMDATKGMLDKVNPNPTEQDPSDHNTYLLGGICGHNIAVCAVSSVFDL